MGESLKEAYDAALAALAAFDEQRDRRAELTPREKAQKAVDDAKSNYDEQLVVATQATDAREKADQGAAVATAEAAAARAEVAASNAYNAGVTSVTCAEPTTSSTLEYAMIGVVGGLFLIVIILLVLYCGKKGSSSHRVTQVQPVNSQV